MPEDATKGKFLGELATSCSQQLPLIESSGFRARGLVEFGLAGELLDVLGPGVGDSQLLYS